jgi:predicted amidohydrolase YtcJ
MSHGAVTDPKAPITIYKAKRFITMDESLPEASHVGVIGERIVSVGTRESMQAWCQGREVIHDERFIDKVVMPGFIDNHVHPFLGALILPTEIIAPEDWRRPDGGVAKAARTAAEYRERLSAWIEACAGKEEWLITWGYQPMEHGKLDRKALDELCPNHPLYIMHRSYHEVYMNSKALEKLDLSEAKNGKHSQIDWERGHFFETGKAVAQRKLMPYLMRKEWYHKGMGMLGQLCLQGGITTIGDQLFGGVDPDYELDALKVEFEDKKVPLRVVNVMDARSFSNRAAGVSNGPPDTPIAWEQGVVAVEKIFSRETRQVKFSRAIKLFADGAMFSQLMVLNNPGYADGHRGEWLMSPEVLKAGLATFWKAGFQIHVHVNGDGGMDSLLDAVSSAQLQQARSDHRLTVHHLGFHAASQTRRLAAMGILASVNPYYIHSLADTYSVFGLSGDRASQIVRAGSLVRAGVPVSFHSDYPMAPVEPLFLAWCAATRTSRSGQTMSPSERLNLEQALRGITIDAAFALRMDHEIGSIVAGKKADFTVLESDPYDTGVDGLKDLRIWGTVMDGQVHALAQPSASVHATGREYAQSLAPTEAHESASPYSTQESTPGDLRQGTLRQKAYRSVSANCCGNAYDHCEIVRSMVGWAREALALSRKAFEPSQHVILDIKP